MEYGAYLMSVLMSVNNGCIINTSNKLILFSNLEYDLQFDKAIEIYNDFKKSKYDNSDIDLYTCIEIYIEKEIKDKEEDNLKLSEGWA